MCIHYGPAHFLYHAPSELTAVFSQNGAVLYADVVRCLYDFSVRNTVPGGHCGILQA